MPGRLWVRIQMLLSGTAQTPLPFRRRSCHHTLARHCLFACVFTSFFATAFACAVAFGRQHRLFGSYPCSGFVCFCTGREDLTKGGTVSLKVTSRLCPPTWCAEDEQEVIHEPNSSRAARSPIPLAAYALAARSLSTCASPTAPHPGETAGHDQPESVVIDSMNHVMISPHASQL